RSQFKWDKAWERKSLHRAKLEDLYAAVGDLRGAYLEVVAGCVVRMPSERIVAPKEFPVERLRMLVGFYAPEVRRFLPKLEEARLEFGDAMLQLIAKQEMNDAKGWSEGLGCVGGAFKRLDAIFDEMEDELVVLSRRWLEN
ncbi:MAG TPA: hypothetical protein VER77_03575, partial [Candidatus Dormibacteraeota bacterium]|nr:hypothetical protein [Candidatus Dormibacteraeota bacterium]